MNLGGYMRAKFGTLVVVAAAAIVASCGGEETPNPTMAEIDLVAQAATAQLNATAQGIHKSLKSANSDAMIYTEELKVPGAGASTPVDWWIYDQGYLKLGGVNQFVAYFKPTPAGESFLAAPPPRWLKASFAGGPELTCSGQRSFAVCKVIGTVAVKPTPEGAAFLRPVAIPNQAIDADLTLSPQGWHVTEMRGGEALVEAGKTALLGSDKEINANRNVYAGKVNRLVR